MAAIVSEEPAVGRSLEELSSEQRCPSGDALAEWRSSEQVENGTPSTSPSYWDTDESDDDGGPKPSELYGRYTWKIEKFSEINKRELRSNAFEVGGYKWYILIYPQGCDVCNHLSLFLCVANHDTLLPGWSHFAQFTIAVVNEDPKKSKYSDTLHRFWKKEHDWGWKKFMELSKISDGFVDADTLIIKAQVQVIREKADHPFRCLDCQYRRELVRVYLTNVEQICRRFVEERRGKLEKLIEDKSRWSSFCAFWLGMDQNARRRMLREKEDMILKVIVKHFFIEKEVTSTLVMDSLYSGLKALEGQSTAHKGKGNLLEGEDTPAPIVRKENDMFVLFDDVLFLLERAAMEPLPPKDEKGPQNRTKDGGNGEDFNKDSIERDERRLTELGRRTVEIFVLAHIFSNKIEVAYQEAVSLRRQEELIREEEAAWLAETEQKAKRGVEKDKKTKKKQGKQKHNNRKAKDKAKEEKPVVAVQVKQLDESLATEGKDLAESKAIPEKDDVLEYVSDVSDSVECTAEVLQLDSEYRDASPINWDTDTSESRPPAEASGSEISITSAARHGRGDTRSLYAMDDSSSTCSTDSAPSVVMHGSCNSNSFANYKSRKSPLRGKGQRGKVAYEEYNSTNGAGSQRSEPTGLITRSETSSHKTVECNESEGSVTSLQDKTKWPELSAVRKDDEVVLLQRKLNNRDPVDVGSLKGNISSITKSPSKNIMIAPSVLPYSDSKSLPHANPVSAARKKLTNGQQPATDTAMTSTNTIQKATVGSRPDSLQINGFKPSDKLNGQQLGALSRPSSAPLVPGNLPTPTVVSEVQSAALSVSPLSQSVGADGSLARDPSPTAHPYIFQSYRNVIIGNSMSGSSAVPNHSHQPASAEVYASSAFSQQPGLAQTPWFLCQATERIEPPDCVSSDISFAAVPEGEDLRSRHWMESPQSHASRSLMFASPSSCHDMPSFDLYRSMNSGSHELFPSQLSVGTSGRQLQGALADEFPHLDIINDLLNDEQAIGRNASESMMFEGMSNDLGLFRSQFTCLTDMNRSIKVSSLGNSCDGSRNFLADDGFQPEYCSSSSQYSSVREFIPHQGNSLPYQNSQNDRVVQNQWQFLAPHLSVPGLKNSGVDGYPYCVSDYSDMVIGINGYTMFRPSNGY